jgi:hypothetical protein
MLIGHFAPAFVLKRARPSVPLWALFLGTQFVDVLWCVFIVAGVEHVRIVPGLTQSNDLDLYDMPWSHSLVAALAWAAAAGLGWALLRRGAASRVAEGVVVAVAVASHFLADLVVHIRDLPVFHGDGPKWGLGLWRHREAALAVEGGLFLLAGLFWWRGERGRRRHHLLVTMTLVLAASFYIPTPPTPALMAATEFATIAAAVWAAWWVERGARA